MVKLSCYLITLRCKARWTSFTASSSPDSQGSLTIETSWLVPFSWCWKGWQWQSEANGVYATFVMVWLANARKRMASTFGLKAYWVMSLLVSSLVHCMMMADWLPFRDTRDQAQTCDMRRQLHSLLPFCCKSPKIDKSWSVLSFLAQDINRALPPHFGFSFFHVQNTLYNPTLKSCPLPTNVS